MTCKETKQIDKVKLLRIFSKDRLAGLLGLEIVEVGLGWAKVRLRVKEEMLNALDMTHGGTLFTAADFALAVASNSYGVAAVSTNVSINYFKPSTAGNIIEATATEESRTRKTGLYRIELNDEQGQKLALAHGSIFILGHQLED